MRAGLPTAQRQVEQTVGPTAALLVLSAHELWRRLSLMRESLVSTKPGLLGPGEVGSATRTFASNARKFPNKTSEICRSALETKG